METDECNDTFPLRASDGFRHAVENRDANEQSGHENTRGGEPRPRVKVFDFRDPDRDQQGAPISGFGVLTGRLFGRLNVIRRIRLPVFPLRIELVHRHQNLQGRLPPDPLRGFKVHRQAHRAFVTLVDRLGAPALQNP